VPIHTPDRRYIVVKGRLWRAANPALSDETRVRFTRELMDARRAVGSAKRARDEVAERRARRAVHGAKVALGERGAVWWADGAPDENRRLIQNTSYAEWWERVSQYRDAILEMLAERGVSKSVCPSEVARRVHASEWRIAMEDVRTAGRLLADEGLIVVTQGAQVLEALEEWRGAVRFRFPSIE
jgi:hypothetical protein